MPQSAARTFADRDAYHAAISNAEVDGVVTARGDYRAELTLIVLHRLQMQRTDESLPRVVNIRAKGTRKGIFFATDQNQPTQQVRGTELAKGEVIAGLDYTDHLRSPAACRWGAMTLTVEDLAAAGQAIVGRELTASSLTYRLRPPPAMLSRLLQLHEAAGQLAKNAPDLLVKNEVARALEQALVHAMVACMSGGAPVASRSVARHHAMVIRRLEEALHANAETPLYMAELCATVGVSYPTLRACCQEHLGMSPKRYLWLRRMHLSRRALRRADSEKTTVTEIATNYGFWELGRFSVAYRSLFGESPSTPLRRPAEDPKPGKIAGPPWEFTKSA
jgi:AraC-like DNA-binding protein